MAVLPYTTDDLTNVRKAIINGVQRVRYAGGPDAGREITYRTLDELRSIESMIVNSLQAASPQSKQIRYVGSKGL